MAAGPAESWYHEKESAWLYRVVAAAEPDRINRDLFVKLAAAAEDQAARWLATRPELTPVFTPALRARTVARLVRKLGPRRLRGVLAAMKLRGLSVYSGSHAPAPHPMPTSVAAWAVGKLLGASIAG